MDNSELIVQTQRDSRRSRFDWDLRPCVADLRVDQKLIGADSASGKAASSRATSSSTLPQRATLSKGDDEQCRWTA